MAVALLCAMPAKSAPPTTVYAGAGNGVFRSTDGGVTWTNLTSAFVPLSLAVDPLNPEVIYAGSNNAVYKTTDGGAHWTKETNGLATADLIVTLQIDPANPHTIYAGAGVFASNGVYKSTDAGVNWTTANSGLTFSSGGILSVLSLALDPLNPNTIYATGNTGFVSAKTTNGGASWTSVGFPGGFGNVAAVNPVQDSTVFMAGPFGLWKSVDAGASWHGTNLSGLSDFIQSLVIDPNTPATMYAGGDGCTGGTPSLCNSTVYKSTDTGSSWSPVGALDPTPGKEYVKALTLDPANPSTLYAGGPSGVWQSTNGGANWTLVQPTEGVNALAMQPNGLQDAIFNLFEALAQDAIRVANDFKSNQRVACGILQGYLNQIPGLVKAGLLSSGQGQALTQQVEAAMATIPCP